MAAAGVNPVVPRLGQWSIWFGRARLAFSLMLSGFLLLLVLNKAQDEAILAELATHARLARNAVAAAWREIDLSGAVVYPDDTLLAQQPKQHGAEILQHLGSAQVLFATALDALNRVQSVGHENGLGFADTLAVRLSTAIGVSEAAKVAGARFEQARPTGTGAHPAADAIWTVSAVAYRDGMSATAAAMDHATAVVRELSDVKAPNLILQFFEGRPPLDFIARLAFATSYVLIGAGVLLLLGQSIGLLDPASSIRKLVDDAAAAPGRNLVSSVRPLLASAGVVASLTAGYALAHPSLRPEPVAPDSHRIGAVAPGDTVLARLDTLARKVDSVQKQADSIDHRAH